MEQVKVIEWFFFNQIRAQNKKTVDPRIRQVVYKYNLQNKFRKDVVLKSYYYYS